MVKIKTDKLPADAMAAKLGCSQDVKQGATVVAYGHPINLNFTATRGIVSSVRTLSSQEFVQMDANINPGNSGGPLLAVEPPEVIGINTLNIAGAPGLGLAVAIRHVCPIIDLLANGGDPSLPSLPVYWLKQGRIETLTVAALFPRQASEPVKATGGLQPNDVVIGYAGGKKLANLPEFYTSLRGRKDRVSLTVQRDGKSIEVEVPLIAARQPLQRQAVTFSGLLVAERVNLDRAELDAAIAARRVHPAGRARVARRLHARRPHRDGWWTSLRQRRRAAWLAERAAGIEQIGRSCPPWLELRHPRHCRISPAGNCAGRIETACRGAVIGKSVLSPYDPTA